jgi:hypothetical protein
MCNFLGKTSLVVSMLKNEEDCFMKKFDKIVWCHGVSAALPSNDQQKIFDRSISGFPVKDIEDGSLFDIKENNCLILDDLMSECGSNPTLTNLFTKVLSYCVLRVIIFFKKTLIFSVFSSF